MFKKIIFVTVIIFCLGIIGCTESNGPYGIDFFWEPINGPSGYMATITVARNGNVWAGTFYNWDYRDGREYLGTIYVSTDNGNTWVEKNNGLAGGSVRSIAINPINNYIFAVVEKLQGVGFFTNYECFRSTDYGESWTKILDAGNTMLITPSGEIYMTPWLNQWLDLTILEGEGIYYSSDNGDTWIKKSNGLPGITSFALGPDGTLYAGIYNSYEKGIYHSTNGGNEWLALTKDIDYPTDITIAPNGSIFVAAAYSGVFKSTDKGITWNQINGGLNVSSNGDYSQVLCIVYNPIINHILCTSFISGGVYRSADLGDSWQRITNGLPSSEYGKADLAINPITGRMFLRSDYNGIHRSTQ